MHLSHKILTLRHRRAVKILTGGHSAKSFPKTWVTSKISITFQIPVSLVPWPDGSPMLLRVNSPLALYHYFISDLFFYRNNGIRFFRIDKLEGKT